jgi:two-component system phosphate regulon response regulator PhoB
MSKILVVDDEPDICELIAMNLRREGHECITCGNGIAVIGLAQEHEPDLVVLDLMLPGQDGFTALKRLRADNRTMQIPVIILTARTQTTDRIGGLELGADDYITKPFSPRELSLRVNAVLRRVKRVESVSEIRLGCFRLDRRNMKLYVDGSLIELTTTEFKLLAMLMENPATPHQRHDLLREVWGYGGDVATRTLDTHIKRLREKLGAAGSCVVTVRGTGYQFREEQTQ